ncbi:type IV pilin protein [Halomonas sp. LS-001]
MFILKRKRFFNKQNLGFTIIELLLVSAIIGILAVITIPYYLDYTQKVTNRACLTNAQSLANIVRMESIIINNSGSNISPNEVLPGWGEVCETLVVDNSGTVNWAANDSGGLGDSGIIITDFDSYVEANPTATGLSSEDITEIDTESPQNKPGWVMRVLKNFFLNEN